MRIFATTFRRGTREGDEWFAVLGKAAKVGGPWDNEKDAQDRCDVVNDAIGEIMTNEKRKIAAWVRSYWRIDDSRRVAEEIESEVYNVEKELFR